MPLFCIHCICLSSFSLRLFDSAANLAAVGRDIEEQLLLTGCRFCIATIHSGTGIQDYARRSGGETTEFTELCQRRPNGLYRSMQRGGYDRVVAFSEHRTVKGADERIFFLRTDDEQAPVQEEAGYTTDAAGPDLGLA